MDDFEMVGLGILFVVFALASYGVAVSYEAPFKVVVFTFTALYHTV